MKFYILSIIIPTYNSQNTIKKCLNSIIKINNIKYELIIVDDGSVDNTLKIINDYSKKYCNVYSFKQSNKGVASARNLGLKYSHGDTVCFIDSDDFIDANKLVKCLQLYYKYHTNLLVSNINFNDKNIGIKKRVVQNNVIRFLQMNYPLYGNELIHVVWNKIYNNSIIKKYNIKFPINLYMGEDLVFVLKYILHLGYNMPIIQTNLTYYNYYVHKTSSTRQFEKNALESKILILRYIKKIYLQYNLSNKSINKLKTKAIYSIMLNSLKSDNKINYLKNMKRKILNIKTFNILNDIKLLFRDRILILFFKYMPIYVYYCFLRFISVIRYIYYLFKY